MKHRIPFLLSSILIVAAASYYMLYAAEPKKVLIKHPHGELSSEQMRNHAQDLFEKGFNKTEKEKIVMELVKRGALYLEQHALDDACHTFSNTQDFISGEVYLFVLDTQGRVFAHGEQSDLIFKNMYEDRDMFGYPFVQEMIKKAQEGGGWVTYSWRNAIKRTYVQAVKKENKIYIVGAGYYPQTKEDLVVGMVKGGVALFEKTMAQGYQVTEPFSTMNYPGNAGVSVGDLYLYALDFKGIVFANADRPKLVGKSAWDYKDPTGLMVNQEIIKRLKESDGNGIWIEYISKNAKKRAYAQKVTDRDGNNYFIACGYYPEADPKAAEDLVGRAAQYMEGHGTGVAADAFSSKRNDAFRYGDLYLVVYDQKGMVVAHGGDDELIGRNMLQERDENDVLYVQELISKALAGGGWVDVKMNHSFQSIYVEAVDIGGNQFIVTCGLYPISKKETMMLLVKSGVTALKQGNPQEVFRSFIDPNGKFIRGDLKLFVLDTNGICYAWGDNHHLLWKNLIDWKDQTGQFFIKEMIEAVKFGPAKVLFQFNGRQAVAHIETVTKDGITYLIGSSFYY